MDMRRVGKIARRALVRQQQSIADRESKRCRWGSEIPCVIRLLDSPLTLRRHADVLDHRLRPGSQSHQSFVAASGFTFPPANWRGPGELTREAPKSHAIFHFSSLARSR